MKQLGLRQLSVDGMLTFGRQFLAGFAQLGSILVISQMLGPEGVGSYTMALFLPTLLALLFSLGIGSANVYFVASGQFDISHAWWVSRDLISGLAIIGLAAGLGLITLAGETLFPGIDGNLLLLAMLVYPPSLMTGVLVSLNQAKEDFRSYNLLVLAQPVIAFLLIAILAILTSFELTMVLAVTVISHFVALIFGLMLLSRTVRVFAASSDAAAYLRPAIRYGIKSQLGNLVGFLNYRIDIFLVNLFGGPVATGLYSTAVRLVEQLWLISQAASTVLLPRLSAMINDEEGKGLLTSLVSRFALWATLFAAGILAAISEPLIVWLFGADFRGATTALLILLPGVVMVSSSRIMANDLAARGMVSANLYLAVLTLILNTIGNIVLIPIFGIVGAAIATSFAYVSDFLIRLILLNRITRVRWWKFLLLQRSDLALIKRVIIRRKTV